jgi:hypothetical protein
MREHVLLFCLLGLVLTATIILVAAPGAVTWTLALIEWAVPAGHPDSRDPAHRGGAFLLATETLFNLKTLRAAELVGLRWDQVDFEGGVLHVTRRKRGTPSTHPISGTTAKSSSCGRRMNG